MKCRFCGADLNPGEKYCKHCGAAVNRGVVGEPSEVKDRGKKFLTRTLIGVAVGGMAIFLLVYMIFFAGVLGNLYESTKDKGGTDTGTVTREAGEDPDAGTAERQMPDLKPSVRCGHPHPYQVRSQDFYQSRSCGRSLFLYADF